MKLCPCLRKARTTWRVSFLCVVPCYRSASNQVVVIQHANVCDGLPQHIGYDRAGGAAVATVTSGHKVNDIPAIRDVFARPIRKPAPSQSGVNPRQSPPGRLPELSLPSVYKPSARPSSAPHKSAANVLVAHMLCICILLKQKHSCSQ